MTLGLCRSYKGLPSEFESKDENSFATIVIKAVADGVVL